MLLFGEHVYGLNVRSIKWIVNNVKLARARFGEVLLNIGVQVDDSISAILQLCIKLSAKPKTNKFSRVSQFEL